MWHVCGKRAVLRLLSIVFFLPACAPQIVSVRSSNMLNMPTVTLSADLPLQYVTMSSATGSVPALAGTTPALAGNVPGLAGNVPGAAGATPALGGSSPDLAGATYTNTTTSYTITANVTYSYPTPIGQPSCEIRTPFSSINCSAFRFLFSNTQITSTTEFRADVFDYTNRSKTLGTSNALAAKKILITQVSNIRNNQAAADDPSYLTVFNNELYFSANNQNRVIPKLFKIDSAGTITQLSNIRNNQNASDLPTFLTVFNNELYFSGLNANGGQKLFKISTAGTITQLSNIQNNQNSHDSPQFLAAFNGELYFGAYNTSNRQKLYKIDTAGTITQVSNTSNNQNTDDSPSGLTVFNNEL